MDVRKVDLSIELQILAFHEQRKAGEEAAVAEAGAAAAAVVPPVRATGPGRKGPDGDLPGVMPA